MAPRTSVWVIAVAAIALCAALGGCWANFPQDLLNGDSQSGDGSVDHPGDVPGSETGVEAGGDTRVDAGPEASTDADGAVGDISVDTTADAPPDQTVDHPPADQTVDTTPKDTTADGPCGQSCPLGCNASAARCNRLDPTNFDVSSFYGSLTSDIDLTSDTFFNTATGQVRAGTTILRAAGNAGTVQGGIYWNTVSQASGYPQIGVFGMRSLRVRQGVTLDFVGADAAAIYTAGGMTIEGTVRASAFARLGGSGGFNGGTVNNTAPTCFSGEGHEGNNQASSRESGGGGGGRGAGGGRGGNITGGSGATGGAGGSPNGTADLSPLYGGCGGGGGDRSTGAGEGGGGGGAIQLAADGIINITGAVTAPGAGGRGSSNSQAGGGGGSGGAVLLEGHRVNVVGVVAANGGGGGAGGTGSHNGQDGRTSLLRANGGVGFGGSNGGRGGARATTMGEQGQTDSTNAGGGGGGVGRVRINAPLQIGATNVSPTPSTSNQVSSF